MSTVAELLVKIGADTSDLKKEINATKRQLKTAFGSDGLALSSGAVKALEGLGVALVGLGAYSVKAAGELENVKVAMTNMLGSVDKAKTFIKELQDFSSHTPFEFNDVTKASQKFLAFGFTVEQIIPTLTAVGDAAAGVGAGKEGVDRLTLALGQIAAKGKLSSEEMKQLTELGIPAWQMLADVLKTDVGTAQDMVTKRMIDSKTALDALVSGMEERYGGMMAEQSKTILGSWSNLMDGIGQVASNLGMVIADSLNITDIFSSIGEWLSEFARAIEENGIGEAISKCIPPEVELAFIALGTALVSIAIPALYATGAAAIAMVAPFVAGIGAAVTAFAPFIIGIVAVTTALYTFFKAGYTVNDLLSLFGINTQTAKRAWDNLKSAFSSFGRLVVSIINNLKPSFTAFLSIIGLVSMVFIKALGMMINAALSFIGTVFKVLDKIYQGFTMLIDYLSNIVESIASVIGNMTDSILPEWANKGIGIISNFVNKATSYLTSLISKITETNEALKSVDGNVNKKDNDASNEDNNKFKKPDFSNFARSNNSEISSIGGGNSSGIGSSIDTLKEEAINVSRAIEREWSQAFHTKTQLLDKWYTEEVDKLDKSKMHNENYERDKTRLSEIYSLKRMDIAYEEAKKLDGIKREILKADMDSSMRNNIFSEASILELEKLKEEHQNAVLDIEDKWQNLSNIYHDLTKEQKDIFLQSLKERQIAFEIMENGELNFHKEMLKDKLSADKEYEDKRLEYYRQCKDIKANIDEAYRTLDMQRLQEVLTEEAAIRLNDMDAQKSMMDTYQEAFRASHMTTAQLVSNLYKAAFTGLESAFTNILTGAKSAKEAFKELGKSMIGVIAQYFAKRMAGALVSHAMGQNIQKKELAQSQAMAAAALSAWTPAAIAYSIIHPGAAARALGEVTSSLVAGATFGASLAPVLSVKGYAKGGYFTRPTLGIIGEGKDHEVALPLNRSVFSNIAQGIKEHGDNTNNTITQNIYGDINNQGSMEELFSDFSDIVIKGLRSV